MTDIEEAQDALMKRVSLLFKNWQNDPASFLPRSSCDQHPLNRRLLAAQGDLARVIEIKKEILVLALNLEEMDIFDGGTKLRQFMSFRDELLTILDPFIPQDIA